MKKEVFYILHGLPDRLVGTEKTSVKPVLHFGMGSYICHGHIIWWAIVYILHALSVKSFLMIVTRNNTNRNLAKIILAITIAHGGDSHEWSY